MAMISREAHELAIAAVDIQNEPDSRRLTTRIRTETNDPSVQLLLAEIVVRLDRIEELLAGTQMLRQREDELHLRA